MTGFDDLDDALGAESDESDRPDGPNSPTDDSSEPDGSDVETFDRTTLPLKFRRDSVKDERDRVDLFVLEETDALETDAIRELDDRLGDSLSVIDAREAIYRAGLSNLSDATDELRGWGYEKG